MLAMVARQMQRFAVAGPPLPAPTSGLSKDGRPQTDVSGWTTPALNDLAETWKGRQEKDAGEMASIFRTTIRKIHVYNRKSAIDDSYESSTHTFGGPSETLLP